MWTVMMAVDAASNNVAVWVVAQLLDNIFGMGTLCMPLACMAFLTNTASSECMVLTRVLTSLNV